MLSFEAVWLSKFHYSPEKWLILRARILLSFICKSVCKIDIRWHTYLSLKLEGCAKLYSVIKNTVLKCYFSVYLYQKSEFVVLERLTSKLPITNVWQSVWTAYLCVSVYRVPRIFWINLGCEWTGMIKWNYSPYHVKDNVSFYSNVIWIYEHLSMHDFNWKTAQKNWDE